MAQGFKPDFLDAFYNMGVAYGCMEENGIDALHKAVWVFKKSIDINEEFIHSYTALGASYIKQNELELAIQVLTRALGVDPEDSNVSYYLGIAHRMNMQFPQAVDYMRQAVALKPDSVQVQFYFGLSLMDIELFDEASAAFREVVRIKPDFAEGHLMLGKLYRENMLDMDKSLHHLKKAEKLFVKLEDYQRVGQIRQLLSRRSK
ncbi:MAG: tetratricopeptide repeat protein [Kordiimonadaceae bacterium]|nr:tetratricopeptide repeat protein [Kordiimonadaceae bacterium]